MKNRTEINIVYATDDSFAKYTAVSIISLLSNTKTFCNIYIIGNLMEYTRYNLKKMEIEGICKFFFITYNTKLLDVFRNIKINSHLSITTYCRLLTHILLPQLTKVIYIDSDSIILKDLQELYDIPLGDNLFAGSEDFSSGYFKQRFQIPKDKIYINCGIILINLKGLRRFDSLTNMINFAISHAELIQTGDQDIINGTFFNKIKKISYRYNFYYEQYAKNRIFIPSDKLDYEDSIKNPVIIHFVGPIKPWHLEKRISLNHKYFYEFWFYARKTPFYEEILLDNILPILHAQNEKAKTTNKRMLFLVYFRYKILSKITWGNKHQHYEQKLKQLHEQT